MIRHLVRLVLAAAFVVCSAAWPLIAVAESPPPAAQQVAGEIATIKDRLAVRFRSGLAGQGMRHAASQRPDGSWPDIVYGDVGSAFPAIVHAQRLEQMARSYTLPADLGYRSDQVLDGIRRGLAYWTIRRPHSANWWYAQIGPQLSLAKALILVGDRLPADLVREAGDMLYGRTLEAEAPSESSVGQNLLWFAELKLAQGLLRGAPQQIGEAVKAAASTIVADGRPSGIQPDMSFHQHGPQLFSGGYGLGYLVDMIRLSAVLRDTSLGFGHEKVRLLSRFLLSGTRLMIRGRSIDFGSMGRYIARPGATGSGAGIVPACDELALQMDSIGTDCARLKQHVSGKGEPASFVGHKHFWNSDFTVHQEPAFYMSVKMVSGRTNGTEAINGENIKGYWLPFGATQIAARGTEYFDIFPAWDWAFVPGVTAPRMLPRVGGITRQPGLFVGGASDGKVGVAGMHLTLPTVSAHKAWFFFEGHVAALGAGIASPAAEPVSTTVNQTSLEGAVLVDGAVAPPGAVRRVPQASWVLHDGIGYLFPKGGALDLAAEARTGSWKAINQLQSEAPVTRNVFRLSIDHGVKPKDGSYAYFVLPGARAGDMERHARTPPMTILSNTRDLQAVADSQSGAIQAVFYAPGAVTRPDGLRIEVDRPCLLSTSETEQGLRIAVASPSGPGDIRIGARRGTRTGRVTVQVPGGSLAGSSQTVTVRLGS